MRLDREIMIKGFDLFAFRCSPGKINSTPCHVCMVKSHKPKSDIFIISPVRLKDELHDGNLVEVIV